MSMTNRKWVLGLLVVLAILTAVLLANCGQGAAEPEPAEEPEAEAEEAEAEEPEAEEPEEEAAPAEPAAEPEEEAAPVEVAAFIFPYGIYPDMHVTDIEAWLAGEEVEAEEGTFLIRTTATNAVGIGTYVAAEAYATSTAGAAPEDFTYEWSLETADGSAAELMTSDVYAVWQADVGGDYVLSLTATDADGNSGSTTWQVHAATFAGVGGLTGENAAAPECSACHADQAEAWSATGHASMLQRGLDGTLSDHYNEGCIECHTTGFYPGADNGGFDDRADAAGWTFPAELKEGNYAALLADFPDAAALANIQCESCHGPGSDHNGDPEMIGRGLNYGTCAQCHSEGPYHVFPQEWELSAHADKNAQAFWYPIGEDHEACLRCHSGSGYIDFAAGKPMEEWRNEYQVITCAVCHNPHEATNEHQLRIFDSVTLPDGTEVAEAGPAATCMSCHNSRTNPAEEVASDEPHWPHYSTAAELMRGTGGYTWGEVLPSSSHGAAVEDECVGCHMAATPGNDEEGAPLPGHLEIGEHTFAMSSADGVENVAVCQACHIHAEAESFAFEAGGDYDGDGTVETNQEEVAGLREVLQAAIEADGVEVLDDYPYYSLPDSVDTDLKGAVYNLKFSGSGGSAVHNLEYTVSLLQLSYEKLTGSPVPGADSIP